MGFEPGTCGVRFHYAIHSPTAASIGDFTKTKVGFQIIGYNSFKMISCNHFQ